jgi:DNA-binding NarL/FixJ family response regulator
MDLKAGRRIRVVLGDEHLLLMEALRERLETDPAIGVVGLATDSDQLVTIALEERPDLLILDVNLPGRGTFDAAQEIITALPKTRLLLLSGHLADIFIGQALQLRMAGYLLKQESFERLREGIHAAIRGELVLSKAVQERITYDPIERRRVPRSESDLSMLTGRQLEVLRHLARGQSVKEIAREMHLSQKSVDSHKYRIMNKLKIHDRVELARFAIREGLMLP